MFSFKTALLLFVTAVIALFGSVLGIAVLVLAGDQVLVSGLSAGTLFGLFIGVAIIATTWIGISDLQQVSSITR